jgi:hypothetical protein
MTYSVWNQGANRYDYYEAGGARREYNEETPKHLRHARLGASPEQAAWPLPAGARRVGSGSIARGRIASRALGAFDDTSLTKIVLLGLAAFLAWKYVK